MKLKFMLNPKVWIMILMQKNIIKVSDRFFLEFLYKMKYKKKIDLENPKTFNEKLQWLKLYNRNPEYTKMADKYEAKKYVANIIGEEYIIPTLGAWDKFEDIDFEKLPNQFVLKPTHTSGTVFICKDKNKLDIEKVRNKMNKCLKRNYFYCGREWPYKNVKPKIIIEKCMSSEKQKELVDYKFFCFNGEPRFLYISEGLSNHSTAKMSFADMEYNMTKFHRKDYEPFKVLPPKPVNFEKMKELAGKLSKDIPFLRVDFYEIEGKIYFGELTFYPGSGYIPFEPEEYDKILGDMLELPKKKREEE